MWYMYDYPSICVVLMRLTQVGHKGPRPGQSEYSIPLDTLLGQGPKLV